MARNALVSLVRAALIAGVAFAMSTGCSRQAEGERCDFLWAGDQDCDDGLVCTPCGNLQDKKIDRCCRPGGSYADTRCIPTTNPTGEVCSHEDVGTAGSGTTSTTGGTGSGATGGMSTIDTGGTSDVAGGSGSPAAGTGG
jgi:hypothetical protein